MTSMNVQPRPTPAERADTPIQVEVDEDLAVFAAMMDDWVAPRPNWELVLQESYESGRANNVEARILCVDGNQTSSLSFRLDQLEMTEDHGAELYLRFEEQDGIAKVARLTSTGLNVELFHILTTT
jgi:hypothetical protein